MYLLSVGDPSYIYWVNPWVLFLIQREYQTQPTFRYSTISFLGLWEVFTSTMNNFFVACSPLIYLIFRIQQQSLSLRKKYPYSELFWSAFSPIRTEYGEILRISPYSVRMWENADQNDSKYGHFLRIVSLCARHLPFFLSFWSIILKYLASFW